MIKLNAPFTAQPAVTASTFVVLQNVDEPVKGALKSLVELGGNPSLHYWIDVYGGSNEAKYNATWTDADVEAAVKAWFAEQAKA